MKYIKLFEDITSKLDSLREFSREHLIDLYNKDFAIRVTPLFGTECANIVIDTVDYPKWGSIKDHVINFIDVLNDEYDISDECFLTPSDNILMIVKNHPSWYNDVIFNDIKSVEKEIRTIEIRMRRGVPGDDSGQFMKDKKEAIEKRRILSKELVEKFPQFKNKSMPNVIFTASEIINDEVKNDMEITQIYIRVEL